jgi:gas vesicle protein
MTSPLAGAGAGAAVGAGASFLPHPTKTRVAATAAMRVFFKVDSFWESGDRFNEGKSSITERTYDNFDAL